MNGLFNIITSFFDSFKFYTTVEPDEKGIRVTIGKYKKTLNPGVHFYLPLGIQRIYALSVVTKAIDIRVQHAVTRDDKTIALGAYLAYSILDVQRAFYEVQDYEESLSNRVLVSVVRYVTGNTFKDCRDQDKINDFLKKEIRKDATDKWGIKIHDAGITDIGECKIIRTLGDGGVVYEEE